MEDQLSEKIKTVHISESTHTQIKTHLEKDGEGRDIGKFVDKACVEKIKKEKKERGEK